MLLFYTLIPKCDNPQGFDDYRLISLMGCSYKIIKILIHYIEKDNGKSHRSY